MLMTTGKTAALSAQRVDARARLVAGRVEGRTRLARLYQDGAAKIRMPTTAGNPLEAILINTAGGLTGGDRIAWDIEAGVGAAVAVTTQACEKVYRAGSGRAEVSARLSAADGARIAWLPQETIVFDRSAFARRLDVDLAGDAQALVVEATIFGRLAMGERVRRAMFRDRWRVRRNGRLIHAEDFAIGPDLEATLGRRAVTGGAIAIATVLLASPDAENLLPEVREIIGEDGGASAWSVDGSGKLLARLFAGDGYLLRQRLVPLVGLLNGKAGLPKVWSL
jgi:urease accessory protein